jgi:hypothetical protein
MDGFQRFRFRKIGTEINQYVIAQGSEPDADGPPIPSIHR